MTEDWLLVAIAEIEETAERASERLRAARDVLAPAKADRIAGIGLTQIADRLARDGAEPRRLVAAAFHDYEHAVARLRARVVRALVDEEGVTLSALARYMGLSRQVVTRLYDSAAPDATSDAPDVTGCA